MQEEIRRRTREAPTDSFVGKLKQHGIQFLRQMPGKPANGSILEPKLFEISHAKGGRFDLETGRDAICPWGVLSGIVLSGGESPPHGEGPDGST